jgi:DNA-damage-inducible protein D
MLEKSAITDEKLSFEDFKHENGITYWWASELMVMLGYEDSKKFKKVIDRATTAMMTLNISHHEQIIFTKREGIDDFKLTRFACYMIAMSGDVKIPEVAGAQALFAEQTQAFQLSLQGSNDMDRLIYRDEFTKGQTSLMTTAKGAGITDSRDFADFNNAGYVALYNQTSLQLKKNRGLGEKGNLQDHMGRTELAANLFRVTQTEEKLKQDNIKSREMAMYAHREVSKRIRSMVKENTGKYPEELKQEISLPEVKKELKKGKKLLDGMDKKSIKKIK